MPKTHKIFITAFIIGATCISTCAAMVFTTPGISETIMMRIRTVFHPEEYSASVWESSKPLVNPFIK